MFIATYPTFLVGFVMLLLSAEDGVARVFVFLITTVCSDVGGYAAGVLVGKHPMAPSISPKKSWEGFAGSVIACMILATLLLAFTFHAPWWTGLVFGAALAGSATVGEIGRASCRERV